MWMSRRIGFVIMAGAAVAAVLGCSRQDAADAPSPDDAQLEELVTRYAFFNDGSEWAIDVNAPAQSTDAYGHTQLQASASFTWLPENGGSGAQRFGVCLIKNIGSACSTAGDCPAAPAGGFDYCLAGVCWQRPGYRHDYCAGTPVDQEYAPPPGGASSWPYYTSRTLTTPLRVVSAGTYGSLACWRDPSSVEQCDTAPTVSTGSTSTVQSCAAGCVFNRSTNTCTCPE